MRTDIGTATRRVQGAIDELDLTVKHIRSAIFGLEASAEGTHELEDRSGL
jgi:hypothetical protein